jgi:hypothetical protein
VDNPFESGSEVPAPRRSTATTLAAVGAWAAAAYWSAMALFLSLGAAMGSVSAVQALLPLALIAFYAWRGAQVWGGNRRVATNLVLLHGIGGVMAVLEVATGDWVVKVMYGLKVLIHVFGGFAALAAAREPTDDGGSANPFS